MKKYLSIAWTFALACMLLTASIGCAESDSIPTYEVLPHSFNDANYIMEHGMGGVELEMVPAEDGSVQGYNDGYSLELNSQIGFFYYKRPNTYPHLFGNVSEMERAWLTDEDKMQLSDEPGLYTPEEAAEAGLQFLRDVMGMDTSCLYAREILAGEADKERSCVYQIQYSYRVPDMRVGWWWTTQRGLNIQLWITDSGVDEAYGCAVSFAPYGEVAQANILAQDAIADLAQSSTPPELMYLPIEQDGKAVLSPIWAANLDDSSPGGYDALTGEKLLSGWDLVDP